jgi:hypothetical protein
MKKTTKLISVFIGVIVLLLVIFAGVLYVNKTTHITPEITESSASDSVVEEAQDVDEIIPEIVEEDKAQEVIYVLYALNVHDWSHGKQSANTVSEVIDLHEEYNVPIEIFVTDPVFQLYMETYPELVERMKTSSVVSVSYHIRPPHPYYGSFDWYGLEELAPSEREEVLRAYEEHKIDLETGAYTDDPGGYQFVKETIGYAPRIVGIFDRKTGGDILGQIYKEKGVQFIVDRSGDPELGEQKYGITIRPEHYDLKIYEYAGGNQTAEQIMTTVVGKLDHSSEQFIGIKYHENNFYHDDNPWYPVYWIDGMVRNGMLEPPFDTSAVLNNFRTGPEQREHWELYEDSLRYVTENRETFTALNAVGLLEEFDWK